MKKYLRFIFLSLLFISHKNLIAQEPKTTEEIKTYVCQYKWFLRRLEDDKSFYTVPIEERGMKMVFLSNGTMYTYLPKEDESKINRIRWELTKNKLVLTHNGEKGIYRFEFKKLAGYKIYLTLQDGDKNPTYVWEQSDKIESPATAKTENNKETGYKINLKLTNYPTSEIHLGYYYGETAYIKDTGVISNDQVIFSNKEKLEAGNYFFAQPSGNIIFPFIIDDNNQRFNIEANFTNLFGNINVSGSEDNQHYFEYLKFIVEKNNIRSGVSKQLSQPGIDKKTKTELEMSLEKLGQEVSQYQQSFINRYPNNIAGKIIKASLSRSSPIFSGTKEQQELQKFYWLKKHWFDNISLSDPCMLRTEVLYSKINTYLEDLTSPDPDSLIQSIDKILDMLQPAPESFKYYLIHFLNKYARSKIIGQDAVYVHLALNYYDKGKAPWTEKEDREKIISNAKKLEHLLIGRKAPDITVESLSGETIRLYDFKAAYTILVFWNSKSSYLKKEMSLLVDIGQQYKNQNVKILSVCTDEIRNQSSNGDWKQFNSDWSKAVSENKMEIFTNTADPLRKSNYFSKYDVNSSILIFVLDKDKIIRSKKIAASDLKGMLDWQLKSR